MWKWIRRKPKQTEQNKTLQELVEEVQQRYEEKQREIRSRYDMNLRQLQAQYEEKIDEERLHEKKLSFQDILQDAEGGNHPFEYTTLTGSIHYKKVTFFRSKQSPNPFRITIEVHKNCIFLSVSKGEKTKAEDSLITLYYDKVKKVYQEYHWAISYDYVTKHHIRMFLYDMIKHVKEDSLHQYPYYKNEFRARDEFWQKEHAWKREYELQVYELDLKKEEELSHVQTLYERELSPYLLELQEIQRQKQQEEEEKRKQKREEELRLLQEAKRKREKEKQQLHGRVFDEAVDAKMKEVFQYVQRLLEKEILLDIEQAYELRRLYEKDLQELWRGFIGLDEKKQKQEKIRFQNLLLRLEGHLQEFEEKMTEKEAFDYEKKMNYMEKKYFA